MIQVHTFLACQMLLLVYKRVADIISSTEIQSLLKIIVKMSFILYYVTTEIILHLNIEMCIITVYVDSLF